MMMTTLALLALTTAQADTATRYTELRDKFTGAATATATLDKQTTWISGRCYQANARNTAVAALLAVETRMPAQNEGPIFDRPMTKLMVMNDRRATRPDHFDEPSPRLLAEIEQFIDARFEDPRFSESVEEAGAYVSTDTSVPARWEVRADEEYHYVRIANVSGENDFAFCYFFKKVK